MYEHGIFVEKDRSKAFDWYHKAAQQEHNLAIEKCQENWN
jgi:TPR repeat protein